MLAMSSGGKNKVYLTSAFSGSMLPESGLLTWKTIPLDEVKHILKSRCNEDNCVIAIGHPSTAELLSSMLDMEITANRVPIHLNKGDEVIVFQLTTRLPEGKVLSKEEIDELVSSGKAKFMLFKIE